MRALVIGGTGFIGPPVVDRLVAGGHEVAVVHRGRGGGADRRRTDVEYITADRQRLADYAAPLRAWRPDVVVDVVLSSGRQGRELTDVFRDHAARLVAVSSMDVYRAAGVLHGSEAGPLEPVPLREDSALRTNSQTYPAAQLAMLKQVFGWLDDEYDKVAVERAVRGEPALPATVVRLPMVYGPGDPLHRLHPALKRMDDGRPAVVLPASLAGWRSPRGYVENVAAAIALAATDGRAAGRVYNVAESPSHSEAEWTRMVGDVVGWRGEVVVVPDEEAPASLRMPGNLAQHWAVDSSRIREELGFREPVATREAIRRAVEWERAHPPAQADPARFDYAAEDAVLAARRA